MAPKVRPAEDRFWAKVDRGGADDCWLWTGCIGTHGYGQFWPVRRAHRFAYQLLVGPIPEGLVLDHLCRNKACVNPAHLEPVTQRTNVLRGLRARPEGARPSHCRHGHLWTAENTYVNKRGSRLCRACKARHAVEYKARERAKNEVAA